MVERWGERCIDETAIGLDYKALITAIELKGRVINRSDMYAISDSIKNALHTHWDKVKELVKEAFSDVMWRVLSEVK